MTSAPDTSGSLDELEKRLDDFDLTVRKYAFKEMRRQGQPLTPNKVNLHAHTFFSYNCYGYSPTKFAWLAHKEGLEVAGVVDFDVLDGVDEFHEAGTKLGLRTCASIESRVYVPEFSDKVINSPGEPGVAYHMGIGFVKSSVPKEAEKFLLQMRENAERRTRELVEKVNDYLTPLRLSFENDLMPLTPNGNATERHVCLAYAIKAQDKLEGDALRDFWAEKLGQLPDDIDLPEGPKLQALLRAKTMKRGGVGYVQPNEHSFPLMADMNKFTLQCGAIPTLAWLDGTTDGEKEMERLFSVGKETGVAALNIIPDRNFTPGVKDENLQNLYDVVALAEKHDFPVIAGTEMNSPGNKFVDDFESEELAPLVYTFRNGAYILYAHTILQRSAGLGYVSEWAKSNFEDAGSRNAFFLEVGKRIPAGTDVITSDINQDSTPNQILDQLKG